MIPLFKVYMSEAVIDPLRDVLLSGYIGQGPKVDEFEDELKDWFSNENVLAVNSCTSALHLALRLADVNQGDEVITTAMTCTATNEPILERGANIVWADIDPTTGNIDPSDVARKITAKTKAILVVHWGGYPCDLEELNAIAKENNVKLIEDAAHAFGAEYKGFKLGCHSDFVCFSFQAIKHFTTVDGGALVCRSSDDYQRGKLLKWYGIDREGERSDFRCEEDILEYGYKFHMNDVTATIGLVQLKEVRGVLERHRENAQYYNQHLKDIPGLRLLKYKVDRASAYWLYTILVEQRLRFMERMKEKEIMVSQVHARNDKHTMMSKFQRHLPGVDAFVQHQVSIPVGWWVTDENREYIVQSINEFSQDIDSEIRVDKRVTSNETSLS